MANITIDGKQHSVKDGVTIIEAIDMVKPALAHHGQCGSKQGQSEQVVSDVPRYCYHPGLSIAGNCRICQVEVEGMPRTVIACNTRVTEGMVIHTQSKKAKDSQKYVLEFLLANHPLDCPVCDQAGECKLQDYYMEYGAYDPNFDENKVKKSKKAFSIGPTIMLDQERCILCTRCVRFTDEVTKTNEFGMFNRGDHAQIDVYSELNNKYSGNVADICPVGALTDKDFRFKMRVWYLGKQKSVCPGCSRGCSISIEFEKNRPYHLKKERVMRLKPVENPENNKWWMCDEGRYAYKAIDLNRIDKVLQGGSTPAEVSWEKALESVSKLIKTAAANPKRWALIASPQYTNETLYLMKKLFVDGIKINYGFAWPFDEGYEDQFLIKKDKNPNTAGASQILSGASEITQLVERAERGEFDGIFIFNRDLSKCGPNVLKTVRSKVQTIVYSGPNINATSQVADWVLPGASYAEVDGTFTNFEGRVQRIRKAVDPAGDARPTWKILRDLAVAQGQEWMFTRVEDVFNGLARHNDAFAGMTYAGLEPYGKIWNAKVNANAGV